MASLVQITPATARRRQPLLARLQRRLALADLVGGRGEGGGDVVDFAQPGLQGHDGSPRPSREAVVRELRMGELMPWATRAASAAASTKARIAALTRTTVSRSLGASTTADGTATAARQPDNGERA